MKSHSEGKKIGHEKAALAANRAGNEWTKLAFNAFKRYARKHKTFTTESVRNANPSLPEPTDPRAWGHVVLMAKKEMIVTPDGWECAKNKNVHARPVTRWKSNLI